MSRWRKLLFIAISHHDQSTTTAFHIPPNRVLQQFAIGQTVAIKLEPSQHGRQGHVRPLQPKDQARALAPRLVGDPGARPRPPGQ